MTAANVGSDREAQAEPNPSALRIAFLGPFGTFTEQALLSQSDLADAQLVPYPTVPDVLDAVTGGAAEYGFVPIENSIEGMVNFTLDSLAFDHHLFIQREVVLDIHLCLVAKPGTEIGEITEVLSIPVATAQCHNFLREHVGHASIAPAASTASAAQRVAEHADGSKTGVLAGIAPRVAAERYGLDVVAADIEDHDRDQTRFVLVTKDGIPAPTGHDRTALVVYQRADEPGSLISILQEFAARRLNLSNLISRPTKAGGLGDYCFIVFVEGHVGDELLADAMKSLHAKQGGVKFFGSWPRADAETGGARTHSDERWQSAERWMADLRSAVGSASTPTS